MKFITIIIISLALANNICALLVGGIRNVQLSTIPSSNITMNASRYNECLCAMLTSTGNSSIVSFNCYTKNINWVFCELFTQANYWLSSNSKIENNPNSTFYFLQLPPINQSAITTADTITTSEAFDATTNMITAPVTLPSTEVFWPFDLNCNDLYNVYNGVSQNNVAFVSPGYTGYGSALSLNASQSSYVLVSEFLNMTYRSFTWELWAYPTNLTNFDNGMVGMCQSTSSDKCLHLMIRNDFSYFGFFNDDCGSSTIVNVNEWHHFAFVYDYNISTQYIFFNGDLVCAHTSSGPFLGNSGSITIGAAHNFVGPAAQSFWTVYIDQLSYVSRAKTAMEILTDATLVAYYSFDNGSFYDSGPNKINGTGVNVSSIIGRVNEGILFNTSGSYFQAGGFTLLGASYRSYSIALWIYRLSSVDGMGTILHLSSTATGAPPGWCMPIIGLTSSKQIVGQSWNQSTISIIGPTLPLGTWTHIVTSYSAINGVRLWVNGSLINESGSFTYVSSGVPNTITLASSLNGTSICANGSIQKGQFYGMMDELRVYARELNASDVYTLANP